MRLSLADGTQEPIKPTLASARIRVARWIGALTICALTNLNGETNRFASEIGDIAPEDICTPVQLLVIDSKRTEELRKSETPRLPAYFRFSTNAVDDPQARLVAAFASMRELFLGELRAEYAKGKLTQPETREQRFLDFRSSFESRHKSFPLTLELAQQWAQGRAGSSVLFAWDTKLRQVMRLYIRPNNLPSEASYSSHVRILTNNMPVTTPVELALAEDESILVPRKNLLTVAQARENLSRRFPANQQAVAAFLGQLLVDNCVYDRKLTELSRAPRVAALWEGDRYTPGQAIVRAGETITPRIKAALDELAAVLPTPVAEPVPQVVVAPSRPPYLFYGAGLLLVFCIGCVIASWRLLFVARKTTALVPLGPGGGRPSALPSGTNDDWLDRALVAEQRARELASDARSALVPKFMQWLKSQGVQNLIRQREELLTTQKLAEIELARLEQMLTEMRAPIEERILAYEERILELEQALKAKGEESRELIETMIRLTRQKLEAERQATPGMTWN